MKFLVFYIIAILFITIDAKHYYVFQLQKLNWHSAFADCRSRGLQLATINSADEQAEVDEAIKKAKAFTDWLWIGATDQGEEGSFVWLPTGKAVSYSHWANQQPDGAFGGEDCVCVWQNPENQFTWNDLRCHAELFYICEDISLCDTED